MTAIAALRSSCRAVAAGGIAHSRCLQDSLCSALCSGCLVFVAGPVGRISEGRIASPPHKPCGQGPVCSSDFFHPSNLLRVRASMRVQHQPEATSFVQHHNILVMTTARAGSQR